MDPTLLGESNVILRSASPGRWLGATAYTLAEPLARRYGFLRNLAQVSRIATRVSVWGGVRHPHPHGWGYGFLRIFAQVSRIATRVSVWGGVRHPHPHGWGYCFLLIFAQVSRRVTVRLNTGAPGRPYFESTVKYPLRSNW